MLRSIVSRALSGGRRTTPTSTRRPTSTPGTTGGSANQEIAKGATSLLRGFGRKRKGL